MRHRMDAVLLGALLVCAFCCAIGVSRWGLADQSDQLDRGVDPTARIVKRPSIKLQVPEKVQATAEIALAAKQPPQRAINSAVDGNSLAPLATGVRKAAVSRGMQKRNAEPAALPARRPRVERNITLPPAGATPHLHVRRKPLNPLPLDIAARPMLNQRGDDSIPGKEKVITIDDPTQAPSLVKQVTHLQPVHPVRSENAPQPYTSQNQAQVTRSQLVPVRVQPVTVDHRGQSLPSSRRRATTTTPRPRVVTADRQPMRKAVPIRPDKIARRPVRQVAEQELFLGMAPDPVAQPDKVSLKGDGELVSLFAKGADLPKVLQMIADREGLNLVLGNKIEGEVRANINGARLDEVLDAILGIQGYSWSVVDNLLYVINPAEMSSTLDPKVQGRMLQVYPLDYVSAEELQPVANTLISSIGTVNAITSSSEDQLKTREMLVVEDTAAGHRRIAQYVAQVDVPPRQVLIEAHVLQVALSEEERHGINWKGLARWRGAEITLEGSQFASADPGGPSVALRVDGQDMDGLIELIRQNTNSRTLASPKVSVVNHQEAKIQIGQRLPYSVATTTQTSTIQNVQFLEVGIVLTVTPVITDDGNVLMTVLPKVSGGKITESGFPEEDTTEVQTTVLMPDGGGIVIGGLIREESSQSKAIVPGFGRVPVVGHFFRRRADEARRNELVVALVTHVLPDVYGQRCKEMKELDCTLPNYSKQDLDHPPLPVRGCYVHD